MELNPGQWTVCHALKCGNLKGTECAGECQYKSEREKLRAVQRAKVAHFLGVQEKQAAPAKEGAHD